MKYLPWYLCCLFFLSACANPTYQEKKIAESIKNIVKKEYKIKNIKVKRRGNTLWIYVPVEKLVDENFELDKDSLEKIGDVSRAGSRVIFSSDSKVKFIALFAYDRFGIELKMIRHIEDIKKVQAWYISYSDFYKRMDINLGFNPEILGKKVVKNIYTDVKKKQGNLNKYLFTKTDENIFSNLPGKFGSIKKLYSLRISETQALIYLETIAPNSRSLFLADVSFFDILKQLLILYLSKEEEIFKNKEKKKINLPVISGYWNLIKESWPEEYKDYKKVDGWENEIYAKEIEFKKFIAEQIERKIKKKFEEKYNEWKIKFKELNVIFLRDEILVTREIRKLNKPVFDVDIDHEINLIIANTIKNYQINDVKVLVIGSPNWKERITIEKERLLKLKQKKWKRLVKEKKAGSITLKDILLDIFVPAYNKQQIDNGQSEEDKKK